ncbi:hypothetical protein H0H92_004857 [Tricholoma furcatifolium]|nr:hypothetical protein H0H92_004857 [Tricholoma furcatifolium]
MKINFGALGGLVAAAVVTTSQAQCPDYTTYSQVRIPFAIFHASAIPSFAHILQSPQGDPSSGPLALPYMRPDPACRTFNSSVVEVHKLDDLEITKRFSLDLQQVITDMKSLIKDPDIARLFENTFPNTLDTTVKYFDATENLAFIITGVGYYVYPELATLVRAVINNEARYLEGGAFQPPPESGLAPTHNDYADGVTVNPPVNNQTVYECKVGVKYEVDSLCGFLKMSRSYYQYTNDSSFINDNWRAAIQQIFRVINEQSQGSWDEDFNFVSYYNWTGGAGSLSPAVNNGGNGEPKAYTGLVGTHHRPSDDLSTFAFLTPANAMLSVELTHLATMLEDVGQMSDVVQEAKTWSSRIYNAIWEHTVENNIFAYETNAAHMVTGYGGRYVMDDANVPSLLSLPYLGFLDKDHPAYVATRQVLLSRGNPYYAAGKNFSGVGPMSQISAIYGTDDDDEILNSLYLIANVRSRI